MSKCKEMEKIFNVAKDLKPNEFLQFYFDDKLFSITQQNPYTVTYSNVRMKTLILRENDESMEFNDRPIYIENKNAS